MAKDLTVNVWKALVAVFLVMLTIFCIGGDIYLFKITLVNVWIISAICTVVAVALVLPMRRMWIWLTGSSYFALNMLCQLAFAVPLLLCLCMSANYLFADRTHGEMTQVTVERVFNETRHRTKRVSRRVYTQGAPYKAYCMTIMLPDKKKRTFDIKKKMYDRVSEGDTLRLPVYKGAIGMKILSIPEIELPEKPEPSYKGESVRERRHRKYQEHINKVLKRGE